MDHNLDGEGMKLTARNQMDSSASSSIAWRKYTAHPSSCYLFFANTKLVTITSGMSKAIKTTNPSGTGR